VAVLALPVVAVAGNPSVKASPSKNLTNGRTVNVTGKGWPGGDSLVIVECNAAAATLTDLNACDITNIVPATASSKGVVAKTAFTFNTGAIGDGTCNAGQTCYIVLTEPSQTGLHALAKVSVSKKA
jgi:hypothetical protein